MRTLALDGAASFAAEDEPAPARIGPNAIIQLGAAVAARLGETARADLFRQAGLQHYLDALPEEMVDESEVVALHRTLRQSLPAGLSRDLSWEAGLRTGDYILAHRIPKIAQRLLKALPYGLAVRALTGAIAKHSWTFAGSGTFRAVSIRPLVIEIANNPMCRGETSSVPLCDYYAGTFTQLYRTLAHPQIVIEETECGGMTDGVCRFEGRLEKPAP